jgi:hypothetical protein
VAPTSPAAGRAARDAGQKDGGEAGEAARWAWRRRRRARVCSISSQRVSIVAQSRPWNMNRTATRQPRVDGK